MTQSLFLSIDVCPGIGIPPLRTNIWLSFPQADLGPKIGPGIVFWRFFEKFESLFSKICAHGERYRNLLVGIFEILTFYGNIAFPLSPVLGFYLVQVNRIRWFLQIYMQTPKFYRNKNNSLPKWFHACVFLVVYRCGCCSSTAWAAYPLLSAARVRRVYYTFNRSKASRGRLRLLPHRVPSRQPDTTLQPLVWFLSLSLAK